MGWLQFFEGRHHLLWEVEQKKYYQEIQSLRSAKQWSVSIIIKIWQVAWELWEHRNNALHNTKHRLQNQEIDEKIQQLWNNRVLCKIKNVAKLIPGTMEEVLSANLNNKVQWVARMEAALTKEETKANSSAYTQERQLMRSYFRR
jgi:hypothetical protein